jgi:hypothetical protein
VLLHQRQRRNDLALRHEPADAEAGHDRFREGAEIDRATFVDRARACVERQERWQRIALEAENLVGIVLDYDRAKPLRVGQQRLARAEVERLAGRVVEIRHRIDQRRRRRAVALRLVERPDDGAARGKDLERAGIGRRLHRHRIAAIDQQRRNEMERLLRAVGEQHVLGAAAHAFRRHVRGDDLAQARIALGGAVLQRALRRRRIGKNARETLPDFVGRKERGVRLARPKSDRIGGARHVGQRADRRWNEARRVGGEASRFARHGVPGAMRAPVSYTLGGAPERATRLPPR